MAPSRRKLKGGTGVIVRILVDLDLNFDGQQAAKMGAQTDRIPAPGCEKVFLPYFSFLYFPVST